LYRFLRAEFEDQREQSGGGWREFRPLIIGDDTIEAQFGYTQQL
jgi:hypothetical protein